jgi:lipopolysaccharide export system protein LptA
VDDGKRIRVTTSGLTFLQKLGIAATDQPLQIVYGEMRGSATGADYESDTGVLKLHSAVEMNGTQNRQAVHVRAAAAEMDRASQRATLRLAHLATDTSAASGDLMVVGLARTGGIENVHAEGHATLESKGGMTAQSPRMDAGMSSTGKLHEVLMQGGVHFANEVGATGNANRAVVHFDPAGNAISADFEGDVQLDQVAGAAHRSVTAAHVLASLGNDATGHTALRGATATGSAFVRASETVAGKAGQPQTTQVTTLRASTLHALTAQRDGVTYVSEITGNGSTQLVQDDGAGTVRTSSGDDLHATLTAPTALAKDRRDATGSKSGSATSNAAKSGPAGQVQAAVQTGHVVVTQRSPAKGTQPAGETRATATRAEFDNATGGLVLTGSPQVTSPVMQLAADRIALQQGSGEAEATGSVRGVYVAASGSSAMGDRSEDKRPADPVHLLADHATISGAGAATKLFGTTGKLARMWSSSAQIEAPVIETDRATGKLFAHAVGSGGENVHMLLPVTAAQGKSAQGATGALRITSGTLIYTPADAGGPAHADLGGGVRMDSPGMQLTAKSAVATIAGSAPVAGRSPLSGGAIQAVTATGDVHLQQPGRSGTGERLVYTAADQRYELTGTAAAPPHLQDSQRGNVTGAVLVFHGDDDRVDVSGGTGHRVRTETEVAKPVKGK